MQKKPPTAWQPLNNTEQLNACATMRNYLIVGNDELLKRNIEALMEQYSIDRHIVYHR